MKLSVTPTKFLSYSLAPISSMVWCTTLINSVAGRSAEAKSKKFRRRRRRKNQQQALEENVTVPLDGFSPISTEVFNGIRERMPLSNWRRNDPLCCCEYINSNDERSHILECCCNCEVLDQTCERLITCRHISRAQISEIMNTIHERFRVPWRGGAKQISCDSILPLFMQPLLAYIAIQNVWCTILAGVILQLLLWYVCRVYVKKNPQTRVFFVWILTSLTLLVLVFEVSVVPLMEILPEENVAFIVLVVCSLFCLYKVWSRSSLNHVIHNSREELLVNRSKVSENVCPSCRKRVPPRTYHCNICQTCVLKKEYHSTWLNCCIGEKNSPLFVLGIFLSFLSFIYGAVLTLTSVCHPFYYLEILLLPDDCSDVYHDVEMAVCFVSALYSLLLAAVLLMLVIHHSWLISLGLTGQEWQELQGADSRCCGLYAHRPYNKGVLTNWINFICSRNVGTS